MRRLFWPILTLLCAVISCLALAQPAPPPAGIESFREPARFTLELHCGSCHSAIEPTANPGALGIFDLTQIEWGAGLTEEQMDFMVERLRALEDIEPEDLAAVEGYVGARVAGGQ